MPPVALEAVVEDVVEEPVPGVVELVADGFALWLVVVDEPPPQPATSRAHAITPPRHEDRRRIIWRVPLGRKCARVAAKPGRRLTAQG